MTPFRITLWVVGGAAAFGLGVWLGAARHAPSAASAENPPDRGRGSAPAQTGAATSSPTNLAPRTRPEWRALLAERVKGGRSPSRRELRAQLAQLSVAEIAALLAELPKSADSEHQWWRQALVESWAAKDPRGALNWVREQDRAGGNGAQGLLNNVLQVWAQSDPAAAAAEVATFKSVEEQRVAIETIFGNWVARDPAAAETWLATLPSGDVREQASVSFARELARVDPRAALEFALAGAPARWSERSVASALGELTRLDPAGALEAFEKLPKGAARERAASRIANTLAEKDPDAAAQFALTLPPGTGRKEALAQVATAMSRSDPDAAVRWLNERVADPAERREGMASLVSELGDRDPATAARILKDLPAAEQAKLSPGLVGRWSWRDPDAALAWTLQQPNTPERAQLARRVLGILSMRDSQRALELAPTLLSGAELSQAYGTIARSWSWREPEKALELARRISDAVNRAEFIAGLGDTLGRTRPQEMLALVATLPAGPEHDRATESAISSWAYRNPRAAAEWLAAQPPEVNAAGFSAAAYNWFDSDPAAAERWLNTLPVGPRRDASLASAAWVVADSDPRRASDLVLSIQDPARRAKALDNFMETWSQRDRATALAWLNSAPLPDATKRRLRDLGR